MEFTSKSVPSFFVCVVFFFLEKLESPSAVPLVLPSCQSVPQTSSGRTSDPTDRIQFGGS